MSDIAGVLKSEISRLSKKNIREHLKPVQVATSSHRRQLAALKRQVGEMEREIGRLRRMVVSEAPAAAATAEKPKARFVAKGLRSLRSRLGLSAEEFGQLLDVSAQTIYNWEGQKTTPRPAQISAIAALRGIGKKEAKARLTADSTAA